MPPARRRRCGWLVSCRCPSEALSELRPGTARTRPGRMGPSPTLARPPHILDTQKSMRPGFSQHHIKRVMLFCR
ncbi:hypothetical protein D1643_02765 [Enterorhabdus sp. P55]|nr:hypothetical protein [Enterorhabdus sp. P55]